MWVHKDATWQIQLNDLYSAAVYAVAAIAVAACSAGLYCSHCCLAWFLHLKRDKSLELFFSHVVCPLGHLTSGVRTLNGIQISDANWGKASNGTCPFLFSSTNCLLREEY